MPLKPLPYYHAGVKPIDLPYLSLARPSIRGKALLIHTKIYIYNDVFMKLIVNCHRMCNIQFTTSHLKI